MKRRWTIGLGTILVSFGVVANFQEVPLETIEELGFTVGTPLMTGFVFIDGRYLPPPYTVTRKGNGLFINRIQFEQPVAWSAMDEAAADAGAVTTRKAADADGDFQEVAAPAAAPAAAPEAAPAKTKAVKSIDDLFADETPAPVAPAAKAPVQANGGETAAQPQPAAAPTPARVTRTPEEITRMKNELRANLDNLRKGYEQALARGEVFFFGQYQNRVNGNYGTARTLMGVLPQALRQAQSPQDLMQLLNRGGIYFLDMGICTALYRNKNTFPLLAERLEKIQSDEQYEALHRGERSAVH